EGRGYVLRLIMRRALYHGQTLSPNEPFLYKISGHVVDLMKGAYPQLADDVEHIVKAIKTEEDNYARTTRRGIEELSSTRILLKNKTKVALRDIEALPRDARDAMVRTISDDRFLCLRGIVSGSAALEFDK